MADETLPREKLEVLQAYEDAEALEEGRAYKCRRCGGIHYHELGIPFLEPL